eukprot:scaffold214556_cov49-Cyclotella_meneghiniana.AAC.1
MQAVNLQLKLTIEAAVQLAPDICNWQRAIASLLINQETRQSLSSVNEEHISNPRTTGIQESCRHGGATIDKYRSIRLNQG